jgi:hypothetical protein
MFSISVLIRVVFEVLTTLVMKKLADVSEEHVASKVGRNQALLATCFTLVSCLI